MRRPKRPVQPKVTGRSEKRATRTSLSGGGQAGGLVPREGAGAGEEGSTERVLSHPGVGGCRGRGGVGARGCRGTAVHRLLQSRGQRARPAPGTPSSPRTSLHLATCSSHRHLPPPAPLRCRRWRSPCCAF